MQRGTWISITIVLLAISFCAGTKFDSGWHQTPRAAYARGFSDGVNAAVEVYVNDADPMVAFLENWGIELPGGFIEALLAE